MKDLIKAKELLAEKDFTCVLVKGEEILVSQKKGISPVLDLLNQKVDLSGFSVADKIVGKAAAMLFCLAKIKKVFAGVISETAIEFLRENGIPFEYDIKTEKIINRKGDGICPMEKCVENISDVNLAFSELVIKRDELRGVKQ